MPIDDGPAVLVTGGGGPAAVAVIRALQRNGRRVVASDADPLAVGLRLADDGACLPRSDDATYVDQLCRLAEKTGAHVLISTLAEEMPLLWDAASQLTRAGLRFWLPPRHAVQTCLDKWRFAEALDARGVPTPTTGRGSAAGVPGPWVVKPRFGRGSRDVHHVAREGDLEWAIRQVPDPLVQTRLPGREFTVDVLVDRDGALKGAVPRWRLETRGGISTKGETFSLAGLAGAVTDVIDAVGLIGAANVQGFATEDAAFVFTEVNPRFSGGLPLSLAAGADLVGEYVRGIEGLTVRADRLTYRPGVRMLRHFVEVFES